MVSCTVTVVVEQLITTESVTVAPPQLAFHCTCIWYVPSLNPVIVLVVSARLVAWLITLPALSVQM